MNTALDGVLEMLDGNSIAPLPIPMHFANIRQFGGLAEMLVPDMVVALAADSGTGKTSVLETMIDGHRRKGWSIMGWSPEWTASNQAKRCIQRLGGPTFMELVRHEAYLTAIKQGIDPNKVGGILLGKERVAETKKLIEKIKSWPGKYDIVEGANTTIEGIIEAFKRAIDAAREEDRRIAIAVLDYAQLLENQEGGDKDRVNRALKTFKRFVIDYHLVGIVTSQVTKQAGALALNGGTNLGIHDLMEARSDIFNLTLTLTRDRYPNGSYKSIATVAIGKNSLGRNGTTKLELDANRLRWVDFNDATPKAGEI